MKLKWKDNTDYEEGYRIDRKVGNSEWVVGYGEVDVDETEWVDGSTVLNNSISYRVYGYAGEYKTRYIQGEIQTSFPVPENLDIKKLEDDELNKDKLKVKISFELPKGCYATELIKFLFH